MLESMLLFRASSVCLYFLLFFFLLTCLDLLVHVPAHFKQIYRSNLSEDTYLKLSLMLTGLMVAVLSRWQTLGWLRTYTVQGTSDRTSLGAMSSCLSSGWLWRACRRECFQRRVMWYVSCMHFFWNCMFTWKRKLCSCKRGTRVMNDLKRLFITVILSVCACATSATIRNVCSHNCTLLIYLKKVP